MDNSEDYYNYIKLKYTDSNEIYDKVFVKEEPYDAFLRASEKMNIYPLFPRIIVMPLKNKAENFKLVEKMNSKFEIYKSELGGFEKLMHNKIKEREEAIIKYKKQHGEQKLDQEYIQRKKIRIYFDYEIRDKVKELIPNSYITNAWCKLYEMLKAYDIFGDIKDEDKMTEIETFHICEHPGAFIYATRDYIERKFTNKKHKFTFQSLKPGYDKQIFKTEEKLLKDFKDNLDYGKSGDGDITNIENILHYSNKYHSRPIRLITSDCGLDFFGDFAGQEDGSLPIFMGALLCAIGIANKGCYYISKLFSFKNPKTIEMMYIGSYFFEGMDIVRPLTSKVGSAEIYVVYKNFLFNHSDKEFRKIYDKLIKYYENYNKNSNFIGFIDDVFLDRVKRFSKLLYMVRITNINFLLFRAFNEDYISNSLEVKLYIKNYTDFLADFFVKQIGLVKIDESDEEIKTQYVLEQDISIPDKLKNQMIKFDEIREKSRRKNVLKYDREDKLLNIFDKKYLILKLDSIQVEYSYEYKQKGGDLEIEELRKQIEEVRRNFRDRTNMKHIYNIQDKLFDKFASFLRDEYGVNLKDFTLFLYSIATHKNIENYLQYKSININKIVDKKYDMLYIHHDNPSRYLTSEMHYNLINSIDKLNIGGTMLIHVNGIIFTDLFIILSDLFENVVLFFPTYFNSYALAVNILLKNKLKDIKLPKYANFEIFIKKTNSSDNLRRKIDSFNKEVMTFSLKYKKILNYMNIINYYDNKLYNTFVLKLTNKLLL